MSPCQCEVGFLSLLFFSSCMMPSCHVRSRRKGKIRPPSFAELSAEWQGLSEEQKEVFATVEGRKEAVPVERKPFPAELSPLGIGGRSSPVTVQNAEPVAEGYLRFVSQS